MFIVPIPESWDPTAHGWRPAPTEIDGPDEYLLRFELPLRFPASLAVMRNPETGQRLGLYGPLASDNTDEPVRQGVLLAEIGITPGDWKPEDRQPEYP